MKKMLNLVTQRAGAAQVSGGSQKYNQIAERYRDEIRLQRNVHTDGITIRDAK